MAVYWGDKRYNSLNNYLRLRFGGKVYKMSLDAGFTCPNRDGRLGTGGCIFCSARGSGDFTAGRAFSISEQWQYNRNLLQGKWQGDKYIAYFQAFTNTYAPVDKLRRLYTEALSQPGVVGLAIATRPDCLPEEVLLLLQELSQQTYLWIELGLQTIHKRTAHLLNLQYDYQIFLQALNALRDLNIHTCAHIILGLPGESREDMLETAYRVGRLPLQGLKIHLLHVLKNTRLGQLYQHKPFPLLQEEEYINLVADILEIINPEIVIHRLTGDGPKDLLLGPRWSLNKLKVLSGIDKELARRDSWQGKYYFK